VLAVLGDDSEGTEDTEPAAEELLSEPAAEVEAEPEAEIEAEVEADEELESETEPAAEAEPELAEPADSLSEADELTSPELLEGPTGPDAEPSSLFGALAVQHNVSYAPNTGGTGTDTQVTSLPETATVELDGETGEGSLTLSATVPVWTDHSFLAWYKDAACTQYAGTAGEAITIDATVGTLYAKWFNSSNVYTVGSGKDYATPKDAIDDTGDKRADNSAPWVMELHSNFTLTAALNITNTTVLIRSAGENRYYLDGNNQYRHIVAGTSANVTISNVILKKGKGDASGGNSIYANGATITLNNSEVIDSNQTTLLSGGGIYAVNGASVTLNSSRVANNVGRIGSGFGGGGICVENSTLVLNRSVMTANKGGSTDGGGGAISAVASSTVTINDSELFGNTAVDSSGGGNADGGGAIYAENKSVVNINNSLIYENINTGTSRGGGGIRSEGATINLDNSKVYENKSDSLTGGGIYATMYTTTSSKSKITLIDSEVYGNAGVGIYIESGDSVTLTNSKVHVNKGNSGGGIYSWQAPVTLTDSEVYENEATVSNGGGIYSTGSVTLNGSSSVHHNTANKNGGGIATANGVVVTLNGSSSVHHNTATTEGGGGIHDAHNSSKVYLYDSSSVYGNEAGTAGGGIMSNGEVNLEGSSSVHDNTAKGTSDDTYGGGGIRGGTIYLSGSASVFNNKASSNGGGIWSNKSVSLNQNSSVHDNTADASGGGIYIYYTTTDYVKLYGSASVSGNMAKGGNGGGIYTKAYVSLYGTSSVTNNTATDSSGTGVGGGIYISDYSKLSIPADYSGDVSVDFSGNRADTLYLPSQKPAAATNVEAAGIASISPAFTGTNYDRLIFNDWDINRDTGDTSATPIQTFTVKFFEQDGTTQIGPVRTAQSGDEVTPPTPPAISGYDFASWVCVSGSTDLSNITENSEFKASYSPIYFTVSFVDHDDKPLGSQQVLPGGDATAPADPTRTGYRFTGWDKPFTNVTSNLTVTAQYVKT
jgi:predicted outer membrane repeat protein